MTQTSSAPRTRNAVLTAISYDHAEARYLTSALHAEQLDTYGFADDPFDTPADHFAAPHGLFVVARVEGRPQALGCGGWRMTDPTTVEIKRMYVHPAARGLALGSQILDLLEQQASECGARRAILETGSRNAAALALYKKFGYTPIPSYIPGRQPSINRAMAKELPRVATAQDRDPVADGPLVGHRSRPGS
ncbi:GNAT family N-acetyltransferase [Kitasatospora sp. NPDC092948]|uniref:GNAT family N-acetyltransferase n=1 Tax=Kitasatospora sp. NPDC092948 TaxID=3364088 RepID=UPI003819B2EE